MILDWKIENQSCSEAKKDRKENAICQDPEFDHGYFCCSGDGFQGNLYLSNGCQGNYTNFS